MKGDALREFDGYVNKQATDKKVCSDVFRKGDQAFLTGNFSVVYFLYVHVHTLQKYQISVLGICKVCKDDDHFFDVFVFDFRGHSNNG